MNKHNVLVFPCGSEIGLEIHRSLQFSTHFRLFGASSVDDHGRFAFRNYIPGLPYADDPEFANAINAVISCNSIDLIIPAHDSAVLALARLAADVALGSRLVTSPLATCELVRSKLKTYRHFAGLIPTPQVYANPEVATYPAFVKPEVGQGSKGAERVFTADHARLLCGADPSLLLLEYLPGVEYTVDCFSDREGKLRYAQGRSRERISNGISVRSRVCNDDRFFELARAINNSIVLRGAWFFQLKARANGELALLEIAPRVAGTMSVSRARGVNLPLLSLYDALDMPVTIEVNSLEVVVDRSLQCRYAHDFAYRRAYLDLDDTVVIDGKVNTAAIAFVYQCRNRGIAVSLITRHAADLDATLAKFSLAAVFDEIIWLRNGEAKSDHIDPRDAIFIDNSWAERESVRTAHGIPTFDTHAIEVLREDD